MKHKVSELEGALLDAAVGKALGWIIDGVWCTDPARQNDPIKLGERGYWSEGEHFSPSANWSDAGPIIERERITLMVYPSECVAYVAAVWEYPIGEEPQEWLGKGEGTTPLIAAMRAYCASKFGEEVELP